MNPTLTTVPQDNQHKLEELYSRKVIRKMILADIESESKVFNACVDAINFLMDGVYYRQKNLRLAECMLPATDIVAELFVAVLPIADMLPIQSVATQLGNRLGYKHLLDSIKTASEIIAVCERSGLYTLIHAADEENESGTLVVKPNYTANPRILEHIAQSIYLPPMVCQPKPWTCNASGGYLEGSGSMILGAINHHTLNQNLDAINTLQAISWELIPEMLEIPETANKPLDTPEKLTQFELFKTQSRRVYKDLLALGNKFYFVWKDDTRGRQYSQGYHVNLQGSKYKKAILQFNQKEVLTT